MASDDIPTVTVSRAAISAASAAAAERVAVWRARLPNPAAEAAARAVGTECYIQGCEQAQLFQCAARGSAGANDAQDCDWPFCGCDEQATKVIDALTEMGWGPLPAAARSDKGDSHA